jgi:exodeoxyribonuclease III
MHDSMLRRGRFHVVPTDFDTYDTRLWKKNALLQPESRAAYAELVDQGWTDALRQLFPQEQVYTFWDYFRKHWQRISDCGSIMCCSRRI